VITVQNNETTTKVKTAEYNVIVKEVSNRLYRYALKLTADTESAKDLVQESFLKLWKNVEKIEPDHARPFLYRVLFNKMVDDKRKMKRITHMDVMPETAVNKNVYNEEKEIIEYAFAQLEDKQKKIIMLRDWDGYSYEEIADILEINLNQVKVNLFRARKKMKAAVSSIDSNIMSKEL